MGVTVIAIVLEFTVAGLAQAAVDVSTQATESPFASELLE
jgi:hypothetical protein